jgi:hypothetical protein
MLVAKIREHQREKGARCKCGSTHLGELIAEVDSN